MNAIPPRHCLVILWLLISQLGIQAADLITNGGFETTGSGWVLQTNGVNQTDSWWNINNSSGAHGGSRYEYLGAQIDGVSAANNVDGTLYQTVSIPSGVSAATLTYWLRITTSEAATAQYDHFYLEIRNTSGSLLQTIHSYSNLDSGTFSSWTQRTANLLSYAGQTIRVSFRGTTDSGVITVFRIDDVSLQTSGGGQAPTVQTLAASSVTTSSAQLNASLNPNGSTTTAYFEYGTTTSYGTQTGSGNFSGTSTLNIQSTRTSLASNTTYHYRVVATNSYGTNRGGDVSFTTGAAAPTVTVTAPNGGENWTAGSTQSITWNGTGSSSNMAYYKIALSTDGGATWPTAGTANDLTPSGLYNPSARSFSWTISASLNISQARIRVRALDASGNILAEDIGNANFTISPIVQPTLTVSPLNASVGASAGNASFSVANSGSGTMSYSTGSPSVSWLHITSGGTGGNSGTINVSYDANTGAQRSGTIQVTAGGAAGSPATITLTQSSNTGSTGGMTFDRAVYFAQHEANFGTPSTSQRSGINTLLGFIESDPALTLDSDFKHLRWAAYMMATARHETAIIYMPIEEFWDLNYHTIRSDRPGHTATSKEDYFNYWYNGVNGNGDYASADGYRFRGRGYVQITGRGNYAAMGADLITNPDLALDPARAYSIMSYGMRNGTFTGVGLGNYITNSTTDYINARRIVNSLDQAEAIANAATKFESILRASLTGTPNTTPPQINAFAVSPSAIMIGQDFTMSYTVSDPGGSGLNRVVLRRTADDGSATDPGWQDIQSQAISGNGSVSGNFTDHPASAGTYWYGIAVFDSASVSTDERAAGLGPKQVTVTGGSIVSVSPSPQSGTTATVGQSFPVSVTVGAEIGTAGVLQVTIFDTVLKQDWVYIAGPQSTVRTFNPPALTATAAGQVQYTIQAKFRPGATSGPLTTSNPNDVDSSISYVVNWQSAPPQTGSIQVNLAPAAAVSAGAQWQVDGGGFQSSGATVSGLSAGSHSVAFKTVSGYTTPNSQTATINANQATTLTAIYIATPPTGSLTVSLGPAGAASAGAQWQVDGGSFQSSGATVSGLSAGNHTVAFKTVSGYTTPSSQTAAINANQTTTLTGTYLATPQTGSLSVNLAPAGAVSAGAQWQVDGGSFQSSGATIGGLSTGSHTVAFKSVSGYTTPSNQTATINANQTTTLTGTYVALPQTGSLTVNLGPAGAVSAGAQWQVDGGGFQSSGATIGALSTGSHTLVFKSVNGWTTPGYQTVSVSANQTTTATGTYTQVSTSSGLFSDDFNDNAIDSAKWTTSGNTVTEASQVMQVLTTVTDAGGNLNSVAFPVSQTGSITFTRKVFLHYANNYFGGLMNIEISGLAKFGIHYENYDYSGPYDVVRHGFFITRNDANPHGVSGQNDTSAAINAVWDTWFNEKVTYDPATGELEYFINDVSKLKYNVGVLPQAASHTMKLSFNAWGWWTGHQQLFDDILVTQSSIPSVITDSTKVGTQTVGNSSYLTFSYRQLIGVNNLTYTVGVSDDMITWDWSEAQIEQVGNPVPTDDGITEEVTVRLKTPMNALPAHKFLRLKVTQAP